MKLLDQYRELRDKNHDIIINENEDLHLYAIKYAHQGVDWDNPLYRQARGLILDEDSNIIIKPYSKFFNLNQLDDRDDLSKETIKLSHLEPEEPQAILEKIDGSLVNYTYDDQYQFLYGTTGAVNSDMFSYPRHFLTNATVEGREWRQFLYEHKRYVFYTELTSKDNQLVEYYGNDYKLWIHGIYDKKIHYELSWGEVKHLFAKWLLKNGELPNLELYMPKNYSDFKIKDITELAKTAHDVEGWVIKYNDGQRIKVKTSEYLEKFYNHTMFFGSPDTVAKLQTMVNTYFDDSWDDIESIVKDHEALHDNFLKVFKFIDSYKEYFTYLKEEYSYLSNKEYAAKHRDKFAYAVLSCLKHSSRILPEKRSEHVDNVEFEDLKQFFLDNLDKHRLEVGYFE